MYVTRFNAVEHTYRCAVLKIQNNAKQFPVIKQMKGMGDGSDKHKLIIVLFSSGKKACFP